MIHSGSRHMKLKQNRIKWANLNLCACLLTTLRWHNVWTEPWEQWWTLAAWSLQLGTRNCCQESTGWLASYVGLLYKGGDCTTHKVSTCGGWDRKNQMRKKATKSSVKVGFSILTMLFKLMLSDKSLSISFYSRVLKPAPRATILHWLRKIYLGKDWFSRTEWDQP